MLTILFAHPKHESLNGHIYKSIQQSCKDSKLDYTTIDLYQDSFAPALTAEELDKYYEGVALDPLVKKYQEILAKTNRLVVIFPIWFNEYPAILKGFFDKICLPNFAFEYSERGIKPKLTNIKSALVVTTSNAPTEVLHKYGNIIGIQFIGHVLKGIGITSNHWINLGSIKKATQEQKDSFINSVMKML